jgi:hypothetical protein
MATAAQVRLLADRWTPFVRTISFEYDLTGADLRLQIRSYPNQPGAPLVDLGLVDTLAAQGLKLASVDNSGPIPISIVSVRINETVMEGLPYMGELGDDSELAWDLLVTPATGLKERWLFGPFIVKAGVTQ